jgi:hypothetical protein
MAERNYGQFKDVAAAKRAPTGDAATLARLVARAVQHDRPRVIYPRVYTIAWWLPTIARYVTARVAPDVTGGITPQ